MILMYAIIAEIDESIHYSLSHVPMCQGCWELTTLQCMAVSRDTTHGTLIRLLGIYNQSI